MKLFTLITLLGAFSVSHAVEVKGTFDNQTTKAAFVGVYAEYVAESSLPTCRSHGIPDGDYHSYAKVKQQLYLVKGNSLKATVPNQFGLCKYTLTHLGVAVIDPKIVDSMKRMGAKEVEKNVLEFKGGFSGLIRLNKEVQGENTLKCEFSDKLVAKCDATEIYLNQNTLLLNVLLD